YLKSIYGFSLKVIDVTEHSYTYKSNAILLNYEKMEYPFPGAYIMNIDNKEIYIAGDNETGVFYGIQTLLQLIPPLKKEVNPQLSIPQLSIKDYPRFPYRGMHLDVARHFFPVSFIKRYIDYLAYHK